MVHLQSGTAKLALSGDSVILRGAQRGNQPPPERTLGLAFIHSPHLGSVKRDVPDEPYSMEARQFLRRRIAGKPIKFVVRYKTPTGREYGSVYLGPDTVGDDVSMKMVSGGWAKVTDHARNKLSRNDTDADEFDLIERLVLEEETAKREKRGMWDPKAMASRPRLTSFDDDPARFLEQNKGRELRATIEHVRDASTLRVMLHLPTAHQMITLLLSGVKAPIVRTNSSGQTEVAEPFGEEAKFNVEIRLLQQEVKVRLEGLPQGTSANGTFVGSIIHSAGNITEWLVSSSFAKVVDWSASFLPGGAAHLRQLERAAKANRIRVWKGFEGPVSQEPAKAFDATVVRILSGDAVIVHDEARDTDREFQLSSIRQPRMSDPDQVGYTEQAREMLRRMCIGKPVSVTVDYHKPATDNFRARDCATIRYKNNDLGVQLVSKGLAGVLKYRPDDNNRSSNYDELLLAEVRAQEAKLGIHSGKPKALVKPADASESATRARSFISHWQRSGRVACIVDYVSGGHRLRLHIPKENVKLTFVLAGVRCPRAPRNDGGSGEPLGAEALRYTTHHAMQRNVEAEFEGVDKTGAFIGTLWLSKEQSLGVGLLEQGLAYVHDIGAEQSPYTNSLYAAQRSAQSERRGMWVNYDPAEEERKAEERAKSNQERQAQAAEELKPRIEFLDVVVSELVSPMSFYVQIARQSVIADLEKLMADLAVSQPPASADFAPKAGQLVSACYTSGDEWHRAKILKVVPEKNEYEVSYIDFGNSETVTRDRVRPLPQKFAATEPYALEAQLAFLTMPSTEFVPDYASDAYAVLRQLVEGRQLVANVEARPSSGPLQVTLYDPSLGRPVLEKSVNGVIAAAGYAVADTNALSSRHNALAATTMEALVNEARTAHRGMWQYGDVTADE